MRAFCFNEGPHRPHHSDSDTHETLDREGGRAGCEGLSEMICALKGVGVTYGDIHLHSNCNLFMTRLHLNFKREKGKNTFISRKRE